MKGWIFFFTTLFFLLGYAWGYHSAKNLLEGIAKREAAKAFAEITKYCGPPKEAEETLL